MNEYLKAMLSVFLSVSLVLVVTSLSTNSTKTEAQSLSDICQRYGLICEAQTAPEEEEAAAPEEEEAAAPEEEEAAAPEEEEAAVTATGGDDRTRMIWTTTRSSALQRDLAKSLPLDSNDIIVFHYGLGRDPTSTEISNLKAVTAVPNQNKGFEFFSLAEIREHSRTVKANGFGFIAYDLERGASPESEVNNPLRSFQEARRAANNAGVQLIAVPSNAISNGQYADDIAKLVHGFHLQSQPRQDDDTTCTAMKNWVTGRVALLERANSNLVGKITYQVTLSGNAASGKTTFETAQDCITAVSPTSVDGNSIWWNAASMDNGQYNELLTYHESTYS